MTPFTSAMLPESVVAERLRDTGEAQSRAEKRFRAGAAAEQLATISWSAPAGPPLDAAVVHAHRADIVVAGQPLSEGEHAGFASDLLYALLMQAGRPLLVIPHVGEYPVVGRQVLIAWKETRESARAVSDALPLLKRAEKVVVMPVASPGDSDSGDAQSGAGIVTWLARHGVVAQVRAEVADDIDVANLLLSRASDLATDLLVMGAYSRARLAERVAGGVTRVILESMTVPVLMSH
jgi:nucleotide-binding universal stress UspA family protein